MALAARYWFPGKIILNVTLGVSRRLESTGTQAVIFQCPPRMAIIS